MHLECWSCRWGEQCFPSFFLPSVPQRTLVFSSIYWEKKKEAIASFLLPPESTCARVSPREEIVCHLSLLIARLSGVLTVS